MSNIVYILGASHNTKEDYVNADIALHNKGYLSYSIVKLEGLSGDVGERVNKALIDECDYIMPLAGYIADPQARAAAEYAIEQGKIFLSRGEIFDND